MLIRLPGTSPRGPRNETKLKDSFDNFIDIKGLDPFWFFSQYLSLLNLHFILYSILTIIYFQNSHFFSLSRNIFSVYSFFLFTQGFYRFSILIYRQDVTGHLGHPLYRNPFGQKIICNPFWGPHTKFNVYNLWLLIE